MHNSDIKLRFTTKNYKIFHNKSLVLCDAQGKEDSQFHFQIGFILNDNKKNKFQSLEAKLKDSISCINGTNTRKLLFTKKLSFFYFLLDSFKLEATSIRIIQKAKNEKEYSFTLNKEQTKVVQEPNRDLSSLFITDTFKNKNETFYLGYEKPKDIFNNYEPLCSILIYPNKILSKKLYLFPTSSQALTNTIFALKNNAAINFQSVGIPYVEYHPSHSSPSYDRDIQTRINLQTAIAEILAHLEKPKCFRKNGSEKANVFKSLAKDISQGVSLEIISNQLNRRDTWKFLAQHRDPWGFFSFFKGKTHSLIVWQELEEMISQYKQPSPTLRI